MCSKKSKINVYIEVFPIEEKLKGNYFEDEKFRNDFQTWLNSLWTEKDKLIDEKLLQ